MNGIIRTILKKIVLNSPILMPGYYYTRRYLGGSRSSALMLSALSYSAKHWIRKMAGKTDIVETTFIISTRCTLRCKDCHNLIPYYRFAQKAEDFPLEEVTDDLAHLLNCVDSLRVLVLIGGEPFLHRNLVEILEYIEGQKKIEKLVLITNGTIMPGDEAVKAMQRFGRRLMVSISNYGSTAPRTQEIAKRLNAAGIAVQVAAEESQWIRTGEVRNYHRSMKELQRFYLSCPMKCNAYLHGDYYVCDQTAHRSDTGLIPMFDEVIHVRELTRNEFKGQWAVFERTKVFQACNYCGHHSDNFVSPAEQTATVEEYSKAIGHPIQ